MKKLIIFTILLSASIGAANAFSNSLDGTNNSIPTQNNNFAKPNANTSTNIPNTPYNPKTHSSYEYNNSTYSNPQMNDTRYNSNCQFGQCIPGGLAPTYQN